MTAAKYCLPKCGKTRIECCPNVVRVQSDVGTPIQTAVGRDRRRQSEVSKGTDDGKRCEVYTAFSEWISHDSWNLKGVQYFTGASDLGENRVQHLMSKLFCHVGDISLWQHPLFP